MKISWVACVVILAALLCMNLAAATENQSQQTSEDDFDSRLDTMSRSSSEIQQLIYENSSHAHDLSQVSDPVTSTKRKLSSDSDFDDWIDRMKKTSSHPHPHPHPPSRPHPHPHSRPHPHPSRKTIEIPKRILKGAPVTKIVVAKDGSGQVKTVQGAVNLVPKHNKNRVVIIIKKGIYWEKVLVPATKPFITFQGEGVHLTYIEFGDTASTKGNNGQPLGTKGSASVAVLASNFIARDISFRNTAPPPPGGAVGRQAVALRIAGDMAAFYNSNVFGAQDTLYDHKGRHYFYSCYIEGSIDFVFGNGRSFYEKCHFHSIANPFGSITAQHRITPTEQTGFSIHNSLVTGSGTIYLGRAWGPASRVVYSFTYFADIILPQGWFDWGIPSRDKTVFYGEYKCYGPGANRQGRVKWSRMLTYSQAEPFLSIGFINGEQWL